MSESTTPGAAAASDEAASLPWHREPWARFAIAFFVIVCVFEALYHGVVLESAIFARFMEGLASAAALLLEPFFENVTRIGTRVATERFVVTVDDGCDGLQICTLLTAAVVAFPSSWRDKLLGIVAGNLWLQLWNVLRISSLVAIGGYQRTWFEPTHVYIWPTLLIALCLATWMGWARWTMRDDERSEPSGA